MALIPHVDIAVSLRDAGYAVPMATEGDGSTTFSAFKTSGWHPGTGGVTFGGVKNYAYFPSYNSGFGPVTEPVQNFSQLGSSLVSNATVTGGVFSQQGCFDGTNFWVFDTTDITTTGAIAVKLQSFPGVIDYTQAGMVPMVIGNQSAGLSFITANPVILKDSTTACCISGFSNGSGTLPAGRYILLVKPDLTNSDWLPDDMNVSFGKFCTSSLPLNGINYQADVSFGGTVSIYTIEYDFVGAVETATLAASGDVSNDAANSFGILGDPNQGGFFITKNGLFGVDSASGNNTGCWYCALDCTAFGKVTFTMPDSSIGPSSDPSVWNVFQGGSDFTYEHFPQVDDTGKWWWIRLPLCDGAGNVIIEPLTMQVYFSGPAGVHKLVQVPPFVLPYRFCGPCRKGNLL